MNYLLLSKFVYKNFLYLHIIRLTHIICQLFSTLFLFVQFLMR